MSARASFWAWEQPIKPASAKLVLLCLADCHNADSGQCNPSFKYIARVTGLDRKTVNSQLKSLVDMGLIDALTTRGKSTMYYINVGFKMPAPVHPTSTENGTSTKNGTSTNIGPPPGPKTVLPPGPILGHEPKREPKRNLKESDLAVQVIDIYHRLLPQLPKVRTITPMRIKQINARDQEVDQNGGWEKCFQAVSRSQFLMGGNQRGWRPDLEWITKRENMNKILEGKYH